MGGGWIRAGGSEGRVDFLRSTVTGGRVQGSQPRLAGGRKCCSRPRSDSDIAIGENSEPSSPNLLLLSWLRIECGWGCVKFAKSALWRGEKRLIQGSEADLCRNRLQIGRRRYYWVVMLLRFRFSNVRSFKDEQELSLVASSWKDLPEVVRHPPGVREGVLPLAAIYGANASGKTRMCFAGWSS